jgi:hypothetical protein
VGKSLVSGVERVLRALLGWPSASGVGYGLTSISQVSMQIPADLDEAENEQN